MLTSRLSTLYKASAPPLGEVRPLLAKQEPQVEVPSIRRPAMIEKLGVLPASDLGQVQCYMARAGSSAHVLRT